MREERVIHEIEEVECYHAFDELECLLSRTGQLDSEQRNVAGDLQCCDSIHELLHEGVEYEDGGAGECMHSLLRRFSK